MKHRKHSSLDNLRPSQLREVLETIRTAVASNKAIKSSTIPIHVVEDALLRGGIRPLILCTGDAHSNPHIDNCLTCAPRWGWVESRDEE